MFVLRLLLRLCAPAGIALLAAATPLSAEPTTAAPPALPDWPDQVASVYSQPAIAAAQRQPPAPQGNPVAPASFEAPPVAVPMVPVVQTAATSVDDPRRLAPRRDRRVSQAAKGGPSNALTEPLPSFGIPFESLYTTGAALAVVVGIFLLFAGLVRRGAKRSNALLPEEVVSVLGRVPLAARQFAELVRVGNKLVLVSITPAGADPLTEITDPAEIDRLVGLCRQRTKGSSTEEFDQVFRKLAEETAPAGFLGDEVPRIDARRSAPADVFAAYRGARSA
jgi:flagellar biogenesis protein FliO